MKFELDNYGLEVERYYRHDYSIIDDITKFYFIQDIRNEFSRPIFDGYIVDYHVVNQYVETLNKDFVLYQFEIESFING